MKNQSRPSAASLRAEPIRTTPAAAEQLPEPSRDILCHVAYLRETAKLLDESSGQLQARLQFAVLHEPVSAANDAAKDGPRPGVSPLSQELQDILTVLHNVNDRLRYLERNVQL